MAEFIGFKANGTIQPHRIVKLDRTSGKNGHVIVAGAATEIGVVGISQQGSHDTPGLTGAATDAARAGLQLKVHVPGEVGVVELGGSVTAGDWLVASTAGVAVALNLAATAVQYVVGLALRTGVSGDFIEVYVSPFAINPANS